MVKISKAQGSGSASRYFEKEYSNARESYYLDAEAEAGEVEGMYVGQLAEEWGLSKVGREDFHLLIEGQDPHSGEQLIKHVASKTYTDKFGNEVTTKEHRAGWDIVLSCPKSVSLCAGPGGDQRIREIQREAVIETLKEMEEYIGAKNGRAGEHTGKMIAAVFQHDCARPDKKTGYAAPDLHDHAFVMNVTRDETGKYRAVEIDTLHKVRKFATQLHWSKLVEKMQPLGYEFEINPRTGAPEVKGFTPEYLAANSLRRDEVLRNEAKMKAEAERAGYKIEGPALRGEAARRDRRSKVFDRDEMLERHQEMDRQHGDQAKRAVERAMTRDRIVLWEDSRRIREAVSYGRDNALDREGVVRQAEIEKHALRRGLGAVTHDQIRAEIGRRVQSGELVEIDRGRGREITSQAMIDLEMRNLDIMRAGQGTMWRVVHPDAVDRTIKGVAQKSLGFPLNDSQHRAVKEILLSRDQVVGLQGYAGTGKTTTLTALRHILESGYEVRGLAPLGRAANLLAEAGIETTTLQKLIASRPDDKQARPRCYFLDESSMVDTKGMNAFLNRVRPVDRVLTIGDIEQHFAIKAGAPFLQFQRAGMLTAVVDDIQRQKDPGLRQVVDTLAKGDTKKAVDLMIRQGRVKEIVDDKQRMTAIAKDYCKEPNALVICLRNTERVDQNQAIRDELHDLKKIGADHQTSIYLNRDMTDANWKFAGDYQIGDVVRYTRGSKTHGIKSGEYMKVTGIDPMNNRLRVKGEDGRTVEYDPKRLSGVSVYYEDSRLFAEGDRIQFRAPLAEKKVTTNELGTIERIDGHRMTVRLDDKEQRQVTIDLKKYRHLDHGYAVTDFSSQGLGAYRAILNADAYESVSLLNKTTAYVSISRAIHDMKVYTNSKDDLAQAFGRHTEKEIAVDALKATHERREERELARAREIEQAQAREAAREAERDRGRSRDFGISR